MKKCTKGRLAPDAAKPLFTDIRLVSSSCGRCEELFRLSGFQAALISHVISTQILWASDLAWRYEAAERVWRRGRKTV